MIFLNAWAFGLLGLAGAIALLYFLRRREERLTVSAIWLWQEEPERPRSALTLMRTKIWLLLMQWAALAALVFALAAPTLTQEFLGGGTLAVIVDGSASMQTQEHEKTRYEQALTIAQKLIEDRRPSRLTVIQAQRSPKLLVPLTTERAQALSALQLSQPTLQSDAPMSTLIELVRSQGELESFDEIVYISDHAPTEEIPMRWIPVGTTRKNVAITGFAARAMPEGSSGVTLWARVENLSLESVAGTLTFFADDREIFRELVALGPSESRSVEASFPKMFTGRFRASLTVSDDFVFDNERYSVIPARPRLKILWLGERNFFLERALDIFAELQIYQDDTAAYDLALANNTHVSAPNASRFFLIQSSLEPLVRLTGSAVEPDPLRILQPSHPLVQHVRVEHLRPTKLHIAELTPAAHVLIQAGDRPVVALYSSESIRFVYLGIDLKSSPLVLTPSFPIFVQSAVRWLLPDFGISREQFVSEGLDAPGFREQGAVNLDPSESKINRFSDGGQTAPRESLKTERAHAQLPLWSYGAWAALGILFAELLLYYRRGRAL